MGRIALRFKGGPGSGHHGHRGRPGKRGGSLPSTGSVTSVWNVSEDAVMVNYFHNMTKEDLEQAYSLPGYDTEFVVSAEGWRVKIEGTYSENGKQIGKFRDEYYYSGGGTAGEKLAVFDLMVFENDFQNVGLATHVVQNKFTFWKKSGFSAVQIDADSVGRYAWAKKGFGYEDNARWTKRSSDRIIGWANKLGIAIGSPSFNSAQDVANFKVSGVKIRGSQIQNQYVPDEMLLDVGKAFMLDMGIDGHGRWDGRYDL